MRLVRSRVLVGDTSGRLVFGRTAWCLGVVLLLGGLGCGEGPAASSGDAGEGDESDAAVADGGSSDAGDVANDLVDDGGTIDGGEALDASVTGDGGDGGDGEPPDAGGPGDGGPADSGPADGGTDLTDDAGTDLADAGVVDAGGGGLDGGCDRGMAPVLFDWPLPGVDGVDWVINNYVDLDRSSGGVRDYTGATGAQAKTYNGHRGVDIDVPSFRAMDADFPVVAAASGVVTVVRDGNFDRNTTCASFDANLVEIRHDDCSRAQYAHFKKGSIVVEVGQRVAAGDVLAVVGSSGCSTTAHLHFELTSASNSLEDPFATGRWRAPPVYDTPLSILDVTYREGSYAEIIEVIDPPPDPAELTGGVAIGIAANVAGGGTGDVVSMRLFRPDGSQADSGEVAFSETFRHSFWWWNRTLGTARGQWRVEVRANGGPPTTRTFRVP